MPIWEGRKSGHVRIFLYLASLYAAMNVRLRSAMLAPAGGGVVSREHDQNPVQVQWLLLLDIGSLFYGDAVIFFWCYIHDSRAAEEYNYP